MRSVHSRQRLLQPDSCVGCNGDTGGQPKLGLERPNLFHPRAELNLTLTDCGMKKPSSQLKFMVLQDYSHNVLVGYGTMDVMQIKFSR